ncbi:MAG: bifunctional glutamate N-acetyltransferase/amino-acid acetyltransferase ArgJ [Pseudomonadota bacterium]
MAVGEVSEAFNIVGGVQLASTHCGIKATGDDLVLISFREGTTTAGVFTQNHFAAAPVQLCRQHLQDGSPRYFLINSGNANCAVGEAGMLDAMNCCASVGASGGVPPHRVLPFSTGVIGERLPADKIVEAIPSLFEGASEGNWLDAARGIMTTDTRPKIATRRSDDGAYTITGIAKGAGMIQPNMATMLAYVATDVAASTSTLEAMLNTTVRRSFNRITVDSDTSTNDACMLSATGASGVDIDADPARAEEFQGLLLDVMQSLAHGLVRDGEGATKFVAINVVNGPDSDYCLEIAYAVANSPLMKTALYASDANWGRIVMAIGKARVPLDVSRLDVFLGDVPLMVQGQKHPEYTEEAGSRVMAADEIEITIDLGVGDVQETVWTSDLSHEYVTINAEYRT